MKATGKTSLSPPSNIRRTGGACLLSARGIRKNFGGQKILRDVSFDLRPGQVVVLRGENGSGKTTLMNILTGNLAPDAGELKCSIDGKNRGFNWPASWWTQANSLGHFNPEKMSCAGVARVWQDIRLFGAFSLMENVVVASPGQLGENPLLALLRPGRIRQQERGNCARAADWLSRLGLADRLESSCDKISLGQMKRTAIARIMQTGARVLMLDEPLAGLDAPGRREVLSYLEELIGLGEYTFIIVEHVFNLPQMLDLATDVWTLKDGVIHLEKPDAVAGELAAEGIGAVPFYADLERTGTPERAASPALEAVGLQVRRGYRRVLDDFSWSVPEGRVGILAHPNGWGKTTFLDAVAGVIPVKRGRILLAGRDLTGMRSWSRAQRGLAYLRSGETVLPRLTVREHLDLARGKPMLADVFPEWRELLPPGERRAGSLSGGEKQRLALGCLTMASVVLMDEPFLGLDQAAVKILKSILRRMPQAVVLATPSVEEVPAARQLNRVKQA